ncbi:unnamed protein product [Phytomonas sp. Hart1]|nr:unnamed protein product [Phytomonas sp. Hart1]|eukprot:CCW72322.1 unnamed protein product [Phytomonas sp. isolate Hart1]
MPEFSKDYNILIGILQSESATLASILECGGRSKVYSTHIFVRRAARLVAQIGRKLAPSLQRKRLPGNNPDAGRTAALHRAHQSCRLTAEAATNELAAGRIDTIPLAIALLSGAARLGCTLGCVLRLTQGRDHCVSHWGADYVNRLENLMRTPSGRKQPRDKAKTDNGVGSSKKSRLENSNPTFGNVVDALI